MALVQYRQFKGEIPAIEPHLLPAGAAQYAKNCQFASGSLQPAKGGLEHGAMMSNPVRGIYTETGISFYTWPKETIAFKAPIFDDAFNRVYFLTPEDGNLMVTSTLNMTFQGPEPSANNSFRVGVPRGTAAPTLTLLDRTTLPDYPAATVSFDVWWEDAGVAYNQVTNASFSTLSAFKKYAITKPTRGESVPETAAAVVRMIIKNGSSEIVNAIVRTTSTTRIGSLPGTQEMSLVDSSQLTLTINWGPEDTRAYVYTYENTWGEEGPPSPPALISPTYIQDVQVTAATTIFGNMRPFGKVNVYRTFGTSPEYVRVSLTGVFPTLIDGSRAPSAVGTSLMSIDWDPPPGGLRGLELLPGGIFAAYSGTSLYLSEPYRPHAFPYIFSLPTMIRGICAAQQSLVVTTADGLYILAGASPSTAQLVKVPVPQPGVSQRAMVNIDGGVAYASRDGIALVDGSSASMTASQKLFGRQKWRELYRSIMDDASMRFAFQDGYLVVSSHTSSDGFTLRFDEDVGSMSRHDQRMDSTFLLPVEDALFYSVGSMIYRYQGGQDLEFEWRGRTEVFAKPEYFGAGYLWAAGPATVQLFMDGVKVYEKLNEPGWFRLPGNLPRCLTLSIGLKSNKIINGIAVARSMAELQIG